MVLSHSIQCTDLVYSWITAKFGPVFIADGTNHYSKFFLSTLDHWGTNNNQQFESYQEYSHQLDIRISKSYADRFQMNFDETRQRAFNNYVHDVIFDLWNENLAFLHRYGIRPRISKALWVFAAEHNIPVDHLDYYRFQKRWYRYRKEHNLLIISRKKSLQTLS